MKVIAFLALCVVAVSARSRNVIQAEGPACPIDPVVIAPGREFNTSLPPILVINPGASRDDLTARGLNGLSYIYGINIITTTIDMDLTLPSVDLSCPSYTGVTGWIDATPLRPETLPSGEFVGQGAASLQASGVRLVGKATLFVNLISNKVTCRELQVDLLSFDSLSADLGQEYLIDGKPIDWAAWSASFKANFEQDWAAFKPEIVEKVRLAANNILEQYTLDDIIDLIGGPSDGECPTKAP